MTSYWTLLLLILPVFALIGIGTGLRRMGWLTTEADSSLLKMVVNFLYPCLIFESVANNEALRIPSNLIFAPLLGFGVMSVQIVAGFYIGKLLGFQKGQGLRTFAFAIGVNNYGYIPIPLMEGLFGKDSIGLLLVHNVGCEAAIWTVGIFVLSGLSLREGWRKLINPPVIALFVAVAVNLSGWGSHLPAAFASVIHQSAACAVPLGLILIGAVLDEYIDQPRQLWAAKVSLASLVLRIGLFPLTYLALAVFLPFTQDLKRVLVVQAAMPTGILLIVIAKHYGGQAIMAVRIVIATTVIGFFTIPLWLRVGLHWIQ